MSTPHNQANVGEIASKVLMPGDPLRAKYIAEHFLTDAKLVNQVRNMFAYTGTYKGYPVTVMASGMGMPSIGIYSYELYSQYDVENIIRIGSCGCYTADLHVYDVVLGTHAYSESTFAKIQNGYDKPTNNPSEELNEKLRAAAKKLNIPMVETGIHSSDVFYREGSLDYIDEIVNVYGAKVCEMESYALFHNASVLGKKAACLLTVSDSFVTHEETTAEERQNSFTNMMKIALEAAE